jgi:hypothetical protein
MRSNMIELNLREAVEELSAMKPALSSSIGRFARDLEAENRPLLSLLAIVAASRISSNWRRTRMKPPYRNDLLPGCSMKRRPGSNSCLLAALVVLKLYVGHNRFVGDV